MPGRTIRNQCDAIVLMQSGSKGVVIGSMACAGKKDDRGRRLAVASRRARSSGGVQDGSLWEVWPAVGRIADKLRREMRRAPTGDATRLGAAREEGGGCVPQGGSGARQEIGRRSGGEQAGDRVEIERRSSGERAGDRVEIGPAELLMPFHISRCSAELPTVIAVVAEALLGRRLIGAACLHLDVLGLHRLALWTFEDAVLVLLTGVRLPSLLVH
mmetsp:Transcript_49608/g.105935  ORF Transcript_49608/g.105935 Transcript_49608/m.105935 type:complete len:215 (-) Transcript_49608:690-1334(-)